jgi:hypothetical protein
MTTPVSCNEIVDFAFHTGEAFILIALVMGALMALAELMKPQKVETPKEGIIDAAEIIRALKDAPVWFALFFAGGALIWLARDTLSLCH